MEDKKKFGELELTILKILWNGEAKSVSDVKKELGDNYAYTTILTVLTRLYQKGILTRIKSGKNYLYKSLKNKEDYISNMIGNLKNIAFDGSTLKMVNFLIEDYKNISKDDLEKISKLIEEKKKNLR